MIIELPQNKNFYRGQNKFTISNGILKISHLASWRTLIYCLAISIKGRTCWYCGKKLKREEITLDHLYPQDLGGPTIPQNLVPACVKCNGRKGNLTEHQYWQWLSAPDKKKGMLHQKFLRINEARKLDNGFYLPKRWITNKKIENIIVNMDLTQEYRGRRYARIEAFYEETGKLPYPIIVDKKNFLLDGFLVLMFAKNNGIKQIPTIVLNNVEMVFNSK